MKTQLICAAAIAITTFSCTKEENTEIPSLRNSESVSLSILEKEALFQNGINVALSNTIEINKIDEITGKSITGYRFDDIFIESQDLKQMTKDFSHQSSETTTKLYVRTNTNRISLPANGKRTIVVAGLSNTERKLDNTQMQALEDAVNDLNSLNLEAVSLKFEKRTEKQHEESNNKNSTVLILRDARNINDFREGEFAIASFSKNGNPGSPITITPNNTELNTPEFFFKGIFLHELGHTFGIVHSDFDTRTSCGLNTTDGSRNRVIEHIPGTSTDTSDTNSIMAACATDIGVFSLTSQDKTAIRRIFQRAEF